MAVLRSALAAGSAAVLAVLLVVLPAAAERGAAAPAPDRADPAGRPLPQASALEILVPAGASSTAAEIEALRQELRALRRVPEASPPLSAREPAAVVAADAPPTAGQPATGQVAPVAPSPAQPALPPALPAVTRHVEVSHRTQWVEPSPETWTGETTPYCVPASLAMVLAQKGVALPQPTLRTLFDAGRAANVTDDPGIDPAGLQALMRRFGGAGVIHQAPSAVQALDEIVSALDRDEPVVAFTRAGDHAVVVHGYERVGAALTAVWVSDPLFAAPLRVSAPSFMGDWLWYGSAFRAAGPQWQGSFVFATYR